MHGRLLTASLSIERSLLRTPDADGGVLVLPEPSLWLYLLHDNAAKFNKTRTRLVGIPLAEWRSRTRAAMMGDRDRPVIMAGHQPEFFHPGVWAKFVLAERFATASGGTPVHLVTDADAPKTHAIITPSLGRGTFTLHHVPSADPPQPLPYEELPALSPDELSLIDSEVSRALGNHREGSAWPRFVDGVRRCTTTSRVDQLVSGFTAIDERFKLSLSRVRAGAFWGGPMLADLVAHGARFAAIHNQVLENYRKRYRIRSPARPMPDLHISAERIELPLWAFRRGEPRQRVFLTNHGADARLSSEQDEIGARDNLIRRLGDEAVGGAGLNGWNMRPRALVLTIWARLMLADVFIHGIGGAKYDEIGDGIIRDYYGMDPPGFACVSATLRLGWTAKRMDGDDLRRLNRELRDRRLNPHGYVHDEAAAELVRQRREAAASCVALRQTSPHAHAERRNVHQSIQRLNRELARWSEPEIESLRQRISRVRQALDQDRIALSRDFFYGLYGEDRLLQLLAALPAIDTFRV